MASSIPVVQSDLGQDLNPQLDSQRAVMWEKQLGNRMECFQRDNQEILRHFQVKVATLRQTFLAYISFPATSSPAENATYRPK